MTKSTTVRYDMSPDGCAVRRHDVDEHAFGNKWLSADNADREELTALRLRLYIAKDKSIVWLNGRQQDMVQMTRKEALELMEILNREFLLDSMGQI